MNEDKDAPGNDLPRAVRAVVEPAGPDSDESVGYRRPPKHSRFQPGRSGNPRGRSPGVKSLSEIVRKIVGQKVTVTENGRVRRVPAGSDPPARCGRSVARRRARPAAPAAIDRAPWRESSTSGERENLAAEDIAILRRYLPDLEEPSSAETDLNSAADADHDLSR